MRIGFLGPEGSFTEEALLSQADLVAAEPVGIGDIVSIIAAVADGDVDMGIVPVENSIEGAVTATLDSLAFEFTDLRVQREIEISIDQNLIVPPATALSDIVEVRTKPEAAAQCRSFLAKFLPRAQVIGSTSTAEAARSLAATSGIAAIGTALAAKLYGLEVLVSHIEDHPGNTTRFWLLGRGMPAPTGHDKTTLVLFQSVDRPGGLIGILQEFAARSINLTKLESRPTKRALGKYCFFLDCDGHIVDELLADAIRNLMAKGNEVSLLGSYPAAGDHGDGLRQNAATAWARAERQVDDWRAEISTIGAIGDASA